MLMGLPVIANVPPDLLGKAVLRDMEEMIHVDGLAPEAIAEKIRKLLDDDALREKIGRGGREFVQRHLNWNQVGQDIEALLFSVAQTGQKGAEW
jgi:glycosyltransferase involved in cell wall biosynthesis